MYIATHLPWHRQVARDKGEEAIPSPRKTKDPGVPTNMLQCPHCNREFREERSLKSHLQDKHFSMEGRASSSFPCQQCEKETGSAKIFKSSKALESHILAKHGIHKYIAPDWSSTRKNTEKDDQLSTVSSPVSDGQVAKSGEEKCPICNVLLNGRSISGHLLDFSPVESIPTHTCSFCFKTFREDRAKLQHENVCSKR